MLWILFYSKNLYTEWFLCIYLFQVFLGTSFMYVKYFLAFTIWYVQALNITQVLPSTIIDVSVNDLISRNERDMVEARKDYYENAKKLNAGNTNGNRLKMGQFVGMVFYCSSSIWCAIFLIVFFIPGIVVLPLFIILFSLLYWGYGMGHYYGWSIIEYVWNINCIISSAKRLICGDLSSTKGANVRIIVFILCPFKMYTEGAALPSFAEK